MSRLPSEQQLRTLHAERSAQLALRENEAWREYLASIRCGDSYAYEMAEPFAWRRLKRALAELHYERRRAQFELDRALVEARGISTAVS